MAHEMTYLGLHVSRQGNLLRHEFRFMKQDFTCETGIAFNLPATAQGNATIAVSESGFELIHAGQNLYSSTAVEAMLGAQLPFDIRFKMIQDIDKACQNDRSSSRKWFAYAAVAASIVIAALVLPIWHLPSMHVSASEENEIAAIRAQTDFLRQKDRDMKDQINAIKAQTQSLGDQAQDIKDRIAHRFPGGLPSQSEGETSSSQRGNSDRSVPIGRFPTDVANVSSRNSDSRNLSRGRFPAGDIPDDIEVLLREGAGKRIGPPHAFGLSD